MTLAEMRALLRRTLASAEHWPDASLNTWIGEGVRLYAAHFGERAVPALDTDEVDVPTEHTEAVTAYVELAAFKALQAVEATSADGSTLALPMLSDQARRAWLRYKDVIDELVAVSACGEAVVWGDVGL